MSMSRSVQNKKGRISDGDIPGANTGRRTTSEEWSLHVSLLPSEEVKYIQISHQVIKDKKRLNG